MRLCMTVLVAVAIAALWPASASAFGKRYGCCTGAGSSGVTTLSGPMTVTTTRTTFLSGSSISLAPNVVSFAPNTVSFGQNIVSFVPNTLNFGPPITGTNVAGGDLATLNQSIQTLNATMTRTNALLAQLVGDDVGPPVGGGGGGGAPNPFGPPPGLSGTSDVPTGAAPRLPYHLYAERQIEQALAAKDGARAAYYYHKNAEITQLRIKEMTDTQKRIDEKIQAAKKAGVAIPGVP